MTCADRMKLLPSRSAAKKEPPIGFANKNRSHLGRIFDVTAKIFITPLSYLNIALASRCHFTGIKAAQMTQMALIPMAHTLSISQRISQILHPSLDAIWPTLDSFSQLMNLPIAELKEILKAHVSTQDGVEIATPHLVIEVLQTILMATLKSCHHRLLSFAHLQFAALCTSTPKLHKLASDQLVKGLRSSLLTHTQSAKSANFAGLLLFPTAARGSICALLHVQEQIEKKLSSDEFEENRQLALCALSDFYVARAAIATLSGWNCLKMTATPLLLSIVKTVAKIGKVLKTLVVLIGQLLEKLRFEQNQEIESHKLKWEISQQVPIVKNEIAALHSPRRKLEAQVRDNPLEFIQNLTTPRNSPRGKKPTSPSPQKNPFSLENCQYLSNLKPQNEVKGGNGRKRMLFGEDFKLGATELHFGKDGALEIKAPLVSSRDWPH